jgi:hypothetical protein
VSNIKDFSKVDDQNPLEFYADTLRHQEEKKSDKDEDFSILPKYNPPDCYTDDILLKDSPRTFASEPFQNHKIQKVRQTPSPDLSQELQNLDLRKYKLQASDPSPIPQKSISTGKFVYPELLCSGVGWATPKAP